MTIEISAVYSTYNRADLLRKALQSLVIQTLPKDRFEVVIVDDGSTDDTQKVIGEFTHLLTLKSLYQDHKGLAAGKNYAIQNSIAPFIVFMDDDDIATPDLLQLHLTKNKETNSNTAILGKTELSNDIADDPLMNFVTNVGCYLFSYPSLIDNNKYDYTYFWGGRSSCKRSLLIENGFFDEDFTFGCEDIELGYRLSKKVNFKVLYVAGAVTAMIRKITFDGFCQRCYNQGTANSIFLSKHPSPEIEAWTQKPEFDENWPAIKEKITLIKNISERLELMVRNRIEQSITPDNVLMELLNRSYYLSFDAFRMLGSSQKWEI